ncbi:MAG: 50S ribosomal protein L13 [Candidatus Pacebacteria bacterium]|nr:50S ribosomal protein L13 [Candidatus Paceibacterota bacterium]
MDYIIDCSQKRLGRVASEAAMILQGKKSPSYDPRLAGSDRVILKNINDLTVGGNKEEQKIYYAHTTQIGHLKERPMKDVIAKHGKGYVLRQAVLHMLPKNKLQAIRIKNLIIE